MSNVKKVFSELVMWWPCFNQ